MREQEKKFSRSKQALRPQANVGTNSLQIKGNLAKKKIKFVTKIEYRVPKMNKKITGITRSPKFNCSKA
jgi:hypothetical protein